MLWSYFAEHLLNDDRPDAINMTLPEDWQKRWRYGFYLDICRPPQIGTAFA